jgi:hypothetical protein
MREIVETFDKTTIVLDGYQEIDNADDENSELLQLLLDLVSESPRTVKVFITCRPQAVPTCIPKGKYQVSIDASAVHDDISLFVEIEAKKHRKWVSWDEDVRNKVIAVLTDPEKHQGMYVELTPKIILSLAKLVFIDMHLTDKIKQLSMGGIPRQGAPRRLLVKAGGNPFSIGALGPAEDL